MTRSRSSERCKRGRGARRAAFTLFELLLVLVIAGLVVGVAIPVTARLLSGADPAQALTTLRGELSAARAEALRRGESVTVELEPFSRGFRARWGGRERAIAAGWLAPPSGEPEVPWRVRFDASGLPDRAALDFPERTDNGVTIWRLNFDPVSGAVGIPVPLGAEP